MCNNNIIKTAVLGAAADAICVCLIYFSTLLLYYYLLLLLCVLYTRMYVIQHICFLQYCNFSRQRWHVLFINNTAQHALLYK